MAETDGAKAERDEATPERCGEHCGGHGSLAHWSALSWPARVVALPIYAYRVVLSPLLPRSCRFEPSCSTYALEALRTHGPARGAWLTLRRLSRCHPIRWLGAGEGYDPVPPARPRGREEPARRR